MNRASAQSTQLVETDRVRVTRFDFAPGAETGWHQHEMDYVITALTDCEMHLEELDGGTRDVTVMAGEAYARDAGVKHNVINRGATPMSFIEVELK